MAEVSLARQDVDVYSADPVEGMRPVPDTQYPEDHKAHIETEALGRTLAESGSSLPAQAHNRTGDGEEHQPPDIASPMQIDEPSHQALVGREHASEPHEIQPVIKPAQPALSAQLPPDELQRPECVEPPSPSNHVQGHDVVVVQQEAPKQKRAAAAQAAKTVKSFISKEATSFPNGKGESHVPYKRGKKRKASDSEDSSRAGPDCMRPDSADNTAGFDVPLVHAGDLPSVADRPEFTSLMTSGRGRSGSLTELIYQKSGGLAALAMSQPVNGHAPGAGGKQKDKPAGTKLYTKKQLAELRLRPDGTPKRAYVRRKPLRQKSTGQSETNGEVKETEAAPSGVKTGRGRGRGRSNLGRGKGRGRGGSRSYKQQDTSSDSEEAEGSVQDFSDMDGCESESCDELYGCSGCKWLPAGCQQCRAESPVIRRPSHVRWKPDQGRPQLDIPEAPTFYPTEEEFANPLTYIDSIRKVGEKTGIACIVPPKGWSPPFALDRGTNGQSADSFRFSIRKQPTYQLCMRPPNAQGTAGRATAAGRYDAEKPEQGDEMLKARSNDEEGGFGFLTLEKTHTLASFQSYCKWNKELHFGLNRRKGDGEAGSREPTVEEIEAEFWRVVETPEEVVESLYGQDLDSGHHGSGFPLPPARKRQLEEHLKVRQSESDSDQDTALHYTPEEEAYSQHCWNINNLPRCKGSVLRYVIGDELITGVMVPWLYVGSCMSAFCWHIEDHALYSINYLHQGSPKVWYGIPSDASAALEQAMRDAFPEHFETAPDLLYQLVTMLSPTQLRERGVPVHRLVHKEGSFVITFPNAYHSGFNTGFNCAEAVNFAPPDWLPWGCSILNKYRRDRKAATLSNDALLVALVKGAEKVHTAASQRAEVERIRVDVTINGDEKVAVKVRADSPDAPKNPGNPNSSERVASGQHASFSGRSAVPGQRADTSYLDAIKVEDAPAEAVKLAIAELALRVAEERRRRNAGLVANPTPSLRRMTGQPGDVDEKGVHTNTEDMDCQECKCDLWMSAILCDALPGKLFCPEHASHLDCSPQDWILLHRYTLEELDAMLAHAESFFQGAREAIQPLIQRIHNPAKVEVKNLGPVANLIPGTPSANEATHQRRKRSREETVPASGTVKAEDDDDGAVPAGSETDRSHPTARASKRAAKVKQECGDTQQPEKPAEEDEWEYGATGVGDDSDPPDDGAIDYDSESDRKRGRGRGRGRGRNAGRGRGQGRSRGRGRGKRITTHEENDEQKSNSQPEDAATELEANAQVQSLLPEHSSAEPAAPESKATEQNAANEVLQQVTAQQNGGPSAVSQGTVMGCVIGMNPSQLAALSGQQKAMQASTSQAAQPQAVQPGSQGAPAIQHHEALNQALFGNVAASSQPGGAAQAKPGHSGLGSSNSVLMDILKASVPLQPLGHITQGSIPLSKAGSAPIPAGQGQTLPVAAQPVNGQSLGSQAQPPTPQLAMHLQSLVPPVPQTVNHPSLPGASSPVTLEVLHSVREGQH